MTSTCSSSLPLPNLPLSATTAHGFPHLASGSLLSIGQLCDSQCTAIFDATSAKVYHNRHITVQPTGPPILTGTRDKHDKLWSVQLPPPPHPPSTPVYRALSAQRPTLSQRISFYHASLFSPTIATWIKAVRLNHLDTWPALTPSQITKFGINTTATIKGHKHALRQNIQSTSKRRNPELPLSFGAAAANIEQVPSLPATRTNIVFTSFQEPTGKVFSDQTGKFVCPSKSGNKYIFILYDYDSNAIHARAIPSRTKKQLVKAYQSVVQELTTRGFKPKLANLDNEISDELKSYLTTEQIDYQLTPAGLHRRNLAERAIQTFKNHFIAGLCSTHPDFPLNLWDELLPQCTTTLNLLRQSRLHPHLSAHAHTYGVFNYTKTPLAPPGMKVLVHERATERGSYDTHVVPGWYIGPALHHYRCYRVWIPETNSERVTDNLTWVPHNIPVPTATQKDLIIASANDLTAALQMFVKSPLIPPADTITRKALLDLSTIFSAEVHPTEDHIILSIRPEPDPIVSPVKNPTAKLPRVPTPTPKAPLPRVPKPKYSPPTTTADYQTHNNTRKSTRRQASASKNTSIPVQASNFAFAPLLPLRVRTLIKNEKLRSSDTSIHPLYKCNSVLDHATGKLLEYRDLIKTDNKENWLNGGSKEFARLAQGRSKDDTKSTNTIFFMHPDELPKGKKATYLRICANYRPQKADPYRVRFTVGGNLVDYKGITYTPTADLTTAKILFNSVLSTPGATFFSIDLSNFYLITPFLNSSDYEYMWIPAWCIPPDIMRDYKLQSKIKNGRVLVEIRTGMYGLPQAGRMAYLKLVKHLAADGYLPTGQTPGLFKHISRPILFNLVVDDFGIKVQGKNHAEHLINTLKKHYDVTVDWEGKIFCGIHLDWDYNDRTVDLFVPKFVKKACTRFGVPTPTKPEHSPHKWNVPNYGSRQQLTDAIDKNPLLTPKQKEFCQQITGTFLWYGRAVDNTMLCPIGAIATAMSTASWKDIDQRLTQFLNYAATHPDARIRYHASQMQLWIHTDASYLNEPKARSRGGGYFFLSDKPKLPISPDDPPPQHNAPILVNSKVIPNVMSSVQESETGMGFLNARDAVPLITTLNEMNHQQGPVPIQFDNLASTGILNDTVAQRRSKAMDMRFYWLRDRAAQKQFHIFWRKGNDNFADYYTKHHSPSHHQTV